jgi:hypothetical protein
VHVVVTISKILDFLWLEILIYDEEDRYFFDCSCIGEIMFCFMLIIIIVVTVV